MAAYFHGAGTDIQADGLQTLYLMNPNYTGYTDAAAAAAAASAPANMVLLNSAMNSMTPGSFGHQPTPQHFVGIPLQPSPAVAGPGPSTQHYNLWAPAMPADSAAPLGPTAQQGLSLSLSSRALAPSSAPVTVATAACADEAKYVGPSPTSATTQTSTGGAHGLVMSSKYLKAAQQLLDEVVSVGKGSKGGEADAKAKSSLAAAKKKEESEDLSGCGGADDAGTKRSPAELSTAERQELQMKKAKLVNMLDEVEQRYRQYRHQMQVVVSSFEAVAGQGSARTYTALALQTISRQFRCLRDAIAGQIRAASRGLGEDDAKTVGSRLRYIDHQLRQQRALQQLGMMQHNAWRPQRGLPERSVSILRAWLFEHFLHPYPKDSDKIMLAKQTGLTRSQVSNWFINARVRLWKPMVEEMYLEETKEQEHNNGGGSGDNSGKSNTETEPAAKSGGAQQESSGNASKAAHGESSKPMDAKNHPSILLPGAMPELGGDQQGQTSFYDDEATLQPKLKKARTDGDTPFHVSGAMSGAMAAPTRHDDVSNRELLMKFMEGSATARVGGHDQGYSLFATGAYQIGDMGRFGSEQFPPRFSGNGVSLTLGLPHGEPTTPFLANMSGSDGGDYPAAAAVAAAAAAAHTSNAYDMNMQNRKSFAAQLMRDFVA